LNFERTLAQLEEIVEKLQKPDLPLDEAVALYRRGTELARDTEDLLASAELQVQELTQAVRERFVQYSTVEIESESDSEVDEGG
jgi:exodeoxyribonuclease VII small subunit